MKQNAEDEVELRKYLLGELTLEEQVSVEARLFLDGEFLSELQAVEDELNDDYAYDELTAGDREKFKNHFLTKPGRHEGLRIAKALKRYLSKNARLVALPVTASLPSSATAPPPPVQGSISFLYALFTRRPVAGLALAAVVLILLSVIMWFFLGSLRGRERSRQMQAQEPTPQQAEPAPNREEKLPANERPPEQGEEAAQREGRDNANGGEKESANRRAGHPRPSPPQTREMTPTRVVAFLLLPGGGVRGEGQTEKVSLSPDIRDVILRLPLSRASDYRSYRATLQADGQNIHAWADLELEETKDGPLVSVKVPAKLLRPRRYQITLEGVTAADQTRRVSSYTFQVERP